ncbi:CBO0543 family protein [Thermohalobacter berrensis]|uniref:Carotenoid biosynthesis protein n=1 Tax=Thermohalobacter berrensis TaxID=99594 RepID=A0A419T796_9FIRM|nr:CBO0543 family protein [Thermohalobacter berrensis]RKD33440.1 hypothetical protein BET03_09310 [Thermohalobacter berrensis]
MNIQPNIETYITLITLALSLIGSYFILRVDWKRYGLIFIISGIVGNILCYIFVRIGLYSFPYRLFPTISIMPFYVILTIFPFYVILGIYYSPKPFVWKIPFYWALIHIGMLFETLAANFTDLIEYNAKWDFWDSYTWWWIFLLVFEWVSIYIIPDEKRKPLDYDILRYDRTGWFILHFILIVTIFLGGFYLGKVL